MKIYAEATTLKDLLAKASELDVVILDGINESTTDIPPITCLLLQVVFGKNTYGVEHWEGYEICFVNDDGHSITIDERTLEVYSYEEGE